MTEEEILDDITDSMDMNLSNLWEIVEDRGDCQSIVMKSQRVGHNLAAEQQQSLKHQTTSKILMFIYF